MPTKRKSIGADVESESGLASDFMFVEVSHTGKVSGKEVRTAMQKYVMRDIGRLRRRRPRSGKAKRSSDPPPPTTKNGGAGLQENRIIGPSSFNSATDISRPLFGGGRMDPFTSYPISMDAETLFLIDYIYTYPHPHLTPFRNSWLPISMTDPAFLHEVLSHVALHVATLRPTTTDSAQSMKHHALAMRSVNERLLDPELGISDGMVGTILAFACFSHSTKDWHSYDIHMEGLKSIIRLRGGVASINHNRTLRLLLSGIDVASACFKNMQPRFPLPVKALSELRTNSQEIPWSIPTEGMSNLWHQAFPSDPTLSSIFGDMSTTVMLIKSECDQRLLWQDTSFVGQHINPLTDRLLESTIEMRDIGLINFMNECSRLAALVLLSKIRRKFGARLVFTGIETQKLKMILANFYDAWSLLKPMLLWLLAIAATEAVGEEKVWFARLASQTARELELFEWEDILAIISNLLWVGEVMDAECELLRPFVVSSFLSGSDDYQGM